MVSPGFRLLCLVLAMTLNVNAAPSPCVIFGTVQKAPGFPAPGTIPLPEPVQGARVAASNTANGTLFEAKTNARGQYRLVVPPGTYAVRAAHSMQTVTLAPGQKKLANFVVPSP